ncbi:MAG: rubredoxin [Desulfobacter postgatei]|uniref:Rubredoxin n=1 Tax=Desulfobacter postgatei TaxID=2293 RepID=A0A2G6MU01_9BACT|nr:MAG: rubredoxin [Desulfobacter postgatei]
MKKWQCSVCKYIHTGDEPPEKCPVCGVDASKFVLLEDPAPDTPEAEPAADENTPDVPSNTANQDAAALEEDRVAVYLKKASDLMLKYHAHPMAVHLPNGVIPVAVLLFILAFFSGSDLLVKAGFINLIFVLISLPLVGLTGFLEWKNKYNQARTTIFKIKIAASTVCATCCVTSIIWYLVDPEVLGSSGAWLFVGVNLLMVGAAGVAGHMGGKLVFKN